jgi:hypothetical protein
MDRKSINILPPHEGPSVQTSDIQGPQGNTNPPLSPVTNSPEHRGGYFNDDSVNGHDYDGPPTHGPLHSTTSPVGADHPYLDGDTQDSYAGPPYGRTARGAADGGVSRDAFGNYNPNEPATSGRTARGAADGGIGYPYNGH